MNLALLCSIVVVTPTLVSQIGEQGLISAQDLVQIQDLAYSIVRKKRRPYFLLILDFFPGPTALLNALLCQLCPLSVYSIGVARPNIF